MPYRGTTHPLSGLISADIGVWRTVKIFTRENILTELLFRLTDAPDGDLVIELNDQPDGSGAQQLVTFASGETYSEELGLSVSMGSLYQSVVSEAGSQIAMNLSGEYTLNTVVGAEDFFTTLAKVKDDANISSVDATRDTVLNVLIAAVTRAMQDWMGRIIVQGTTTEKIDGFFSDKIYTKHFPILEITALTEDSEALVEDTDFESVNDDLEAGRIIRLNSGYPAAWITGRRSIGITYDHGYITVPASLEQAATALVVQKYNETAQSGKSWRGLDSLGVDPGSASTFDKEIWERETIPAMQPFKAP